MVNVLSHSETRMKVRVTPGVAHNKAVICAIAHMCLMFFPPLCLCHNRISFQQNPVSQQEQGKNALPCQQIGEDELWLFHPRLLEA